MKIVAFKLANKLYKHCYPVYRLLYANWKVISDRNERALLRSLIKPGMIVLDIGANIGIYSCFLSRLVGKGGVVYAFEPDPINFSRLVKNTQGIKNIIPVHTAVGEKTGELNLYISDDMNVDHRSYDSGDKRRCVKVPVVRLDDYFNKDQHIDFMKIDVQGYEYNILQGAKRTIDLSSNLKMIMEFWPYGLKKAGTVPRKLLDLISSLGLVVEREEILSTYSLDEDSSGASGEYDYCNILISKPKHEHS